MGSKVDSRILVSGIDGPCISAPLDHSPLSPKAQQLPPIPIISASDSTPTLAAKSVQVISPKPLGPFYESNQELLRLFKARYTPNALQAILDRFSFSYTGYQKRIEEGYVDLKDKLESFELNWISQVITPKLKEIGYCSDEIDFALYRAKKDPKFIPTIGSLREASENPRAASLAAMEVFNTLLENCIIYRNKKIASLELAFGKKALEPIWNEIVKCKKPDEGFSKEQVAICCKGLVEAYGKDQALVYACSNPLCPPEAVEVLIGMGASVNAKDAKGSALRQACEQRSIGKIKILVAKGANIHRRIGRVSSPLQYAATQNLPAQVMALLGCSEKEAEIFINDTYPQWQRLVHIHSLTGGEFSTYEGMSDEGYREIINLFGRMPQAMWGELFYLKKHVSNALAKAFIAHCQMNASDITKDIKSQKLAIIHTGYEGHRISITLANGYMTIENAGYGCLEKTIVAYRINESQFTEDLVRQLLDLKNEKDPKKALNFIYGTGPDSLLGKVTVKGADGNPWPLKDAVCIELEKLSIEKQKGGHCAYVNGFKAPLRTSIALLRIVNINGKKYLFPEDAALARDFSKRVSTYFRDITLSSDARFPKLNLECAKKTIKHVAKTQGYQPQNPLVKILVAKPEEIAGFNLSQLETLIEWLEKGLTCSREVIEALIMRNQQLRNGNVQKCDDLQGRLTKIRFDAIQLPSEESSHVYRQKKRPTHQFLRRRHSSSAID